MVPGKIPEQWLACVYGSLVKFSLSIGWLNAWKLEDSHFSGWKKVKVTLRPKCIAVYGEVQEYCLPPGKIQWTLQRYFVGRFSFHLLYLSGADARICCTIHFQDFAIVHAYVLINRFSESKFEMSADFWQWIFPNPDQSSVISATSA